MGDNNKELGSFPYLYRFNDERYNVLPKNDIEKICPISKNESALLWEKNIDSIKAHYKECASIVNRIKEIKGDCGWGDYESEEETRKLLRRMDDGSSEIILFWSKHYSVKTVWKIFCQYWSDFCYPSDDGNIILHKNNIIIYDEDKLYEI